MGSVRRGEGTGIISVVNPSSLKTCKHSFRCSCPKLIFWNEVCDQNLSLYFPAVSLYRALKAEYLSLKSSLSQCYHRLTFQNLEDAGFFLLMWGLFVCLFVLNSIIRAFVSPSEIPFIKIILSSSFLDIKEGFFCPDQRGRKLLLSCCHAWMALWMNEFGGAAKYLTPGRVLWPGMYFWQLSKPHASYWRCVSTATNWD